MNAYGTEVRHKALSLLHSGARNADVARRLGLPASTVGVWLHRDRARRGELPVARSHECPRCDGRALDTKAYSYLLGWYLGDGYISQHPEHRAPSLRITCDDSWPGLMAECERTIRAVFPDGSTCRARKIGCHDIKIYSTHLPCLFPQHGPGKKHERTIALAPWQQEIVDAHPWAFIRGLIHSDGCRIINWTTRLVAGERKRYEYPRYFFTNKSDDIRKLFSDTLTKVGVEWTTLARGSDPFNISIARKASVALMDAHVGEKY
ncbi:helix-turn-helix domain-containing protein [Streptomyces sp. p1417]|uniref:Helix-turn-helix domain-containing protein n=1 Tax=Streptomyces typhae TaxID=2681492 RepID=A0A6L6WZS5_9ACTN|nr:helix-turn-helix domain-containing protein [Streptomyces typhae]MVO87012.1 helix-turn-helix domain-containing protein [Streptomyces typhae]